MTDIVHTLFVATDDSLRLISGESVVAEMRIINMRSCRVFDTTEHVC